MTPPIVLTLDIETDGEPFGGRLLEAGALLSDPRQAASQWVERDLESLLADVTLPKVTHTKYDLRWLRLAGWQAAGPLYDTQVMAWLLNENQALDLESLARKYVGIEMDKRLRRMGGRIFFRTDEGPTVPIAEAPPEQMRAYNRRDVETTAKLFEALWKLLEDQMWLGHFLDERVPETSALLDMECAGLPIDLGATENFREELEREVEAAGASMHNTYNLPKAFNLGSGDHLAAYLFHRTFTVADAIEITPEEREQAKAGEWPAPPGFDAGKVGRKYVHGTWTVKGRNLAATEKSEKKDRPTTSTPKLMVKHGGDEFVRELIAWRRGTKVLNTYLRRFPERSHNGRLYGRFNQTGTKTGRLSSSEPNLQNIPAHGELGPRVRGLFVGSLVVGDYSQLEPRLMAHFSRDRVLVSTYREGRDVYLVTAEGVFGRTVEKHEPERQIAKTLVLALGYGAGPGKLAEILSLNGHPTSEYTARGYLKELRGLYREFFDWRDDVIEHAKERGYVTTLSGGRRRLGAQFKETWNAKTIGYGERQAVNAVVQGSAADIVRATMVQTAAPDNMRLLAQVHDELLWEYRPDPELGFRADKMLPWLCEVAERGHGYDLHVPLVFEPTVCRSWAEKGGTPVVLEEEVV